MDLPSFKAEFIRFAHGHELRVSFNALEFYNHESAERFFWIFDRHCRRELEERFSGERANQSTILQAEGLVKSWLHGLILEDVLWKEPTGLWETRKRELFND